MSNLLFDINNCPTLEEIRYVLEDPGPHPFVPRKPRSVVPLSSQVIWRLGVRWTVNEAAEMLRISATKLKKLCREHGIAQWPRRYAESLEQLLEYPALNEEEKQAVRAILNTSFSHKFNLSVKQDYLIKSLQKKMYKHRNKNKTRDLISEESRSDDSSSGVSDSRISGDFDDVRPGAGHDVQTKRRRGRRGVSEKSLSGMLSSSRQ